MPNRHLTVVLPSLLTNVTYHRELQLPHLQRLLTRAQNVTMGVSEHYEKIMFGLFSLPIPHELPIATLTGLVDGLDTRQSFWLRADPVELRADLAAVYFMGSRALGADDKLKVLLAADEIKLHCPHPERWYLELARDPQIITAFPTAIIGKDISPYLPTGLLQNYWRKLFTEVQMLIHARHTSDFSQGQQVQAAANALWFWGAGRLPIVPKTSWQKVWSNDVLAQGLALQSEVPGLVIPSNFAECIREINNDGEYLLALNSDLTPEELLELDTDLFATLVSALRSKQLTTVNLYLGQQKIYHVTAKSIRYFWRKGFLR